MAGGVWGRGGRWEVLGVAGVDGAVVVVVGSLGDAWGVEGVRGPPGLVYTPRCPLGARV